MNRLSTVIDQPKGGRERIKEVKEDDYPGRRRTSA